jgi:hypothetical protein
VVGSVDNDMIIRLQKIGIHHYKWLDRCNLMNLLRQATACVDSLSIKGIGLTVSSSLKSKEYIALGLPIIGACVSMEEWGRYTYTVCDDELDFQSIHQWCNRTTQTYNVRKIEAKFLLENKISWSAVSKKYRNFLHEVA